MVASSPRPAFLCSGQVGGPGGRATPQRAARLEAPAPVPPGRVAFLTHRGEPAEAILAADGTWACPRLPVLDRVLNALFAPRGDDPAARSAAVARVAAWIKGEARP